ncbi:MAG: LodA/GoxA family CTQ-dependent oxidase [Crocinitomicaceae bacterium]
MKDQKKPSFRIYPSIGIARMGNGPATKEDVVFSPEVPWKNLFDATIVPHTAMGALKKQAQRFYIYKCDDQGKPTEKISPNDYDIEWFVEVANKKPFWYDFNNSLDLSVDLNGNNKNLSKKFYEDRIAPGISASSRNPNIPSEGVDEKGIPNSRKELINGPNFGSVSLANNRMELEGLFPFPRKGEVSNIANKLRTTSKSVKLGTIEYDEDRSNPETNGSLIFYSGDGVSASLNPSDLNTDFADNSNWYDDICDGRVTAKITPKGGGETIVLDGPEAAAWIASAPPDYAPQINPISSLFDLVTGAAPGDVKTDDESCLSMVLPLFFKYYQMQWVNLSDFLAPSFKEVIDQMIANKTFHYLYTSGSESEKVRKAIFDLFRNPRYDYINEGIIPAKDVTSFDALGIPPLPSKLPYYVGDGVNYPGSPAQWFAIPPMLYDQMERWSKGEFKTPEKLAKAAPTNMIALGEYYQSDFVEAAKDPKKAPLLMTRAVLETLYGGGFHPGVELTWPMRHNQMYRTNELAYSSVNGSQKYDLFGLREVRINSASKEKQDEIFFNDFGFLMTQEDVRKSMDEKNEEYWLWQTTPGDLTKWMGIPWQSDAGSCQAVWIDSQYPVPSWWAANLPIDVLTNESYTRIKDGNTLPDTKRNIYASRQPWLQTTDTGYVGYHAEGGYMNGLINMVYQWDQIGSVAARKLDLDGYPETVYVSFKGRDVANSHPVLLGVEYPSEPAPKREAFYERTVKSVLIPEGKLVILSGEPDGTGTTYVDDQVTISVDGTVVFEFDYSHGNSGRIIPKDPVDLTEKFKQFVGKKVEITTKYSDLWGGYQGASSFFLVFK